MAKEKEYKKVSGARYWFRVVRLWQGKDHLLLAQSSGYTEEYKRFFFRDIQAILIRPSNQRVIWSVIWGSFIVGIFFGAIALKPWNSVAFWICAAVFLLGLLVNLVMGQGCVCHLKTAIQTVELPITRRPQAEKWVKRWSSLILSAQESLPEPLVTGPTHLQPSSPSVSASVPAAIPSAPKAFRAQAHWVLFTVMLLLGLFEASRFVTLSLVLYAVGVVLEFSMFGLSVIALIWQSQTEAPSMLRKVTLWTFLFIIADYLIGIFYGSFQAISHPQKAMGQMGWLKWLASQAPDSSGFQLFYSGYIIIGCLLFGLLGLVELSFYRKHQKRA